MSEGARLVEGWDGRDYERHSAHQRAWGSAIVAALDLEGGERVLDLGCGDGSVTRALAARVPRGSVLGIDAAPEMLEAARAKCLPNMAVRQLDIDRLDVGPEFDLVFSNAALHWVHDHAGLLRRVHAALRPGGALCAEFGSEGNVPNLLACLRSVMGRPPFGTAFAGFRWPWCFPSATEYEALLRASPFAEWRVSPRARDQRFPSREALIGWIDNPCLIPFLRFLPAGLRQGFRDGVVEAMVGRTRQPDGSYLEPFRRIEVRARR